jgi:hypothetical protein
MVGRGTLAVARQHAVVAGPDHLLVVETGAATVSRIDLPRVLDVAMLGGELWVAAGLPPRLHRIRLAGATPAGPPLALWGDLGVLRPTAVGKPAALWTASPAATVSIDGSVIPVPGEWDAVFPVTASRWVACRRDRIALRDPTTERWSIACALGGARIVDGAVLFDGRSAALAVAHAGVLTQLIVIGLHDGTIQHRVTLTGIGLVRFAPARGLALFCSGPRTLVIFDLRFGRVLKEYIERRDVADAALDSAGQTFVVRYGDAVDDLAFGLVRDVLSEGRPAPAEAPPSHEAVESEPGIHTPEVAPAAPAHDFHRGHPPLGELTALAPRAVVAPIPPEQAVALVGHYGELVASLLGRAIALAWDSGRIAFPNENMLPFRGEVTGILGVTTGRAGEEIAAADRRVLAATAAVRDAEASAGPGVSPMAALAAELELSPVARLLLLLIAGPALWGELARLYGILGNDEERPLVDEMLLVQILSGQVERHAITRELDRDAPLIRHGIIRIGDGRMRPFIALTCDPVVLRILHGDREPMLEDIRIVQRSCSYEDLLVPAATKTAIVRALAAASVPSQIVVRGRTGSGRHTTLATLAAAANRSLAIIDATALVHDLRNRIGQLRTALCRAHVLGFLPCIDGLETMSAEDRIGRDLVVKVLDAHPGPLAVRLPWDARPILQPGYVAVDLPPLSLQQRTACWHVLLGARGVFVRDPDELADRYGIGPGVIDRVCTQVAHHTSGEPGIDRSLELEIAIRQHLETGLRATATRVERLATWSRVVLPADVQDSVLELIARIRHRRTVYDAWGYDQVLTTSRGVTALFQGGPGTGKTLVASAIANELGMDLYRVELSRIMSKWIGETEQNLAKLFDAAEDGHAIILFDEADSLFAKRTEVRTSVDRYANLEVNYLLQRLDSFEGIAILTTNFGTSIDTAFKRRLSFRLTFPFPDEDAREALWKAHMAPGVPKAGGFDFAELARRYQLSGGYIRNAAVRAAFLAAEEQSPLTQDHLVRAIQAEFREIGKIAETGVLE